MNKKKLAIIIAVAVVVVAVAAVAVLCGTGVLNGAIGNLAGALK